MSTRSIVAFTMPAARYSDRGGPVRVKGVGVHYDGMPDSMGPELTVIFARDGFRAARKAILAHPDWASIEAGDPQDPSSTPDNPRYRAGYGRWFNEDGMAKKDLDICYFTPDKLIRWWDSEYVYLVSPKGIRYVDVGVRNPTDPNNDWDTLAWKELP